MAFSPETYAKAKKYTDEHGGGSGTDANAVHYTADSNKTDAQKAQARDNIGVTQLLADKVGTSVVADAYDNTATYAVGDYCVHDGVMYKCNTAISTAEEWTAAHWTAKQIVEEFGGEMKVKVAGTALTPAADGYVNIPQFGTWGQYGIPKYLYNNGIGVGGNGVIKVLTADPRYQHGRQEGNCEVISTGNLDFYNKIVMTDGIGEKWTYVEKQGAWSRLNSIFDSLNYIPLSESYNPPYNGRYYNGGGTKYEPSWTTNTYYTKTDGVYTVQTTQPSDWSSNWRTYYSYSSVLVAGAKYFLGEQSTISLTLPTVSSPAAATDPLTGQEISVVFYSGSTAATLTSSSVFLGTLPTPAANQRIELNFLWDGTYWCLVSKVDAVPTEAV